MTETRRGLGFIAVYTGLVCACASAAKHIELSPPAATRPVAATVSRAIHWPVRGQHYLALKLGAGGSPWVLDSGLSYLIFMRTSRCGGQPLTMFPGGITGYIFQLSGHLQLSGAATSGTVVCSERSNGSLEIEGEMRFNVSGRDESEVFTVRLPRTVFKRDTLALALIGDPSLMSAEPGLRAWTDAE